MHVRLLIVSLSCFIFQSTLYLMRRRCLELVIAGSWVTLLMFLVWTLANQHNPAFSLQTRTIQDEERKRQGHPVVRAMYPLPFRPNRSKGPKPKAVDAHVNITKGKNKILTLGNAKVLVTRGKESPRHVATTTASPRGRGGERKAVQHMRTTASLVDRERKPAKGSKNFRKDPKVPDHPSKRGVQSNPARPHRERKVAV